MPSALLPPMTWLASPEAACVVKSLKGIGRLIENEPLLDVARCHPEPSSLLTPTRCISSFGCCAGAGVTVRSRAARATNTDRRLARAGAINDLLGFERPLKQPTCLVQKGEADAASNAGAACGHRATISPGKRRCAGQFRHPIAPRRRHANQVDRLAAHDQLSPQLCGDIGARAAVRQRRQSNEEQPMADTILDGSGEQIPGQRLLAGTDLEIAYSLLGDDLVLRVNKAGVQVFGVVLEDAAKPMTAQKILELKSEKSDLVVRIGTRSDAVAGFGYRLGRVAGKLIKAAREKKS